MLQPLGYLFYFFRYICHNFVEENNDIINFLKYADMKKFLSLLIILGIATGFTNCSCGDAITVESLLDEMLSIEQLAEWPEVEYLQLQMSSYDRKSVEKGNAEWFANNDGRGIIRIDTVENRIEKVLFDEQHPGVITRIWNTTTDTNGVLRFYFDGHTTPDWVVEAYDFTKFGVDAIGKGLLECHTNYKKGVRGGNTFFMPIPYAKSCKITLEEFSPEKNLPRYHQINFRRYPEGTRIETFSEEVALRAAAKIGEVCRLLNTPLTPEGNKESYQASLAKDESLTITLPEGTNIINALVVNLKSEADYGDQMRRLILSASFDGVQTVWVPMADFSGAGLGAAEVHSRYLESDGKQTTKSFWPMPYREKAVITLKNISDVRSDVEVEIYTSAYEFNNNTLYFHSSWRQECGLPVTNLHAECRDWDFATLKGRGVYRGDVLTLFNHSPKWYGEGDEKIYVDGEEFPSHFGTGTEDYYNSSWAPVVPFHTPFGGAPRADLASSHGYSSWLRTRALDAIPFHESLDFDIELISWRPGTVDYATTVYWYGDLTAEALDTTSEEEAARPMPEEPENPADFVMADNAIEFENCESVVKPENITIRNQEMSGFEGYRWSRGVHALYRGGNVGDKFEITIPNFENGCYRVVLHATKAPDYGRVKLHLVEANSSKRFDGYSKSVATSGPIDLGIAKVTNGLLTLGVEIVGKNNLSKGCLVGLDCLVVEKI